MKFLVCTHHVSYRRLNGGGGGMLAMADAGVTANGTERERRLLRTSVSIDSTVCIHLYDAKLYCISLKVIRRTLPIHRLKVQLYLGIRLLWNKSNLVYVLFGREKFCLVYELCLEYDSRARICMSQNES
jgi:hypothetical protein